VLLAFLLLVFHPFQQGAGSNHWDGDEPRGRRHTEEPGYDMPPQKEDYPGLASFPGGLGTRLAPGSLWES